MFSVSFLCYTVYKAKKYQNNVYSFNFLNLNCMCFITLFAIYFLCTFQLFMCPYFINCVHMHTHTALREHPSQDNFMNSNNLSTRDRVKKNI